MKTIIKSQCEDINIKEVEEVLNKKLNKNKDYINQCTMDYLTFGAAIFNTDELK